MLKILSAYGIPPEIVSAIRVMYENTTALVILSKATLKFSRSILVFFKGIHSRPFYLLLKGWYNNSCFKKICFSTNKKV